MGFYESARSDGGFEDGIEAALQRILVDPEFLFRIERDPPQVAAGHGLPHQRPRARVAPVVLPVEQHSRRRASRSRRARQAERAGDCSKQQVKRMLADPRAEALVEELRRPVAVSAQRRSRFGPIRTSSPTSTRTCATAFQKETELFFESIISRRQERARSRETRTTPSSTSAWRATTASRTSTAASSGASRSVTRTARASSDRAAS